MDYCYQCRRHLNGALACAGCGTPAEELRQQAPVPPGPQHSADPGQDAGSDSDHEEFADVPEGEEPLIGHDPSPDAAPGRTERRRTEQRRARGERGRRGRLIVIGVLGVVLAAGGLGVAQFALRDQGKAGATAVKEEASLDGDTVPQASDRPAVPDAPAPVVPPSASADDSPTPADSREASPTSSPDASTSPSATPRTGSTAPAAPHSQDPHVSASGTGSESGSGHHHHSSGPTGGPTSPAPSLGSPTPKPSKTDECTHILWWCG
jgi:hypothetical protein